MPVGPRHPLPLACPPRVISQDQWPDTFTAPVSTLIRRNSAAFLSSLQRAHETWRGDKTRAGHMIQGNTPPCRSLNSESFSSLNKRASRPRKAQRHHELRYISSIHSVRATHPVLYLAAGRALISRHTEPKGCNEGWIISLQKMHYIMVSCLRLFK